ncbi:MAG: LacI family DNA-binding transcriptional regulator [Planctomycetota bacterium]
MGAEAFSFNSAFKGGADASCVHIDDIRAAREATTYLIERGHRRITFYNDLLRDTGHCSVTERLEGYTQAMREAGLSASIESVVAEQDEYADHLVKLGPGKRPTAVLGYDDIRVMDLMLELWRRGMVFPRDLSLMGFNDEISSKYTIPPLTTMGFPVAEVADAGAQAMLRRIAGIGLNGKEMTTIPMTLIERDSVGPLANG